MRTASETADHYEVHIKKSHSNDRLGLVMRFYNEHESLATVLHVTDGLIDEWNQRNPHSPVSPTDKLLEINGIKQRAGAPLLTEQLLASDELHLLFQRS